MPSDFSFPPHRSETIHATPRAFGLYAHGTKRALDIVLICLAAPFVVPIVLILAGLVALDGHNPFYHQPRIGRGGRIFTMWKLRTMVPDADGRLACFLDENADARHEWDCTQKLKHDPRITRFGCFLRKASLDELPQLWNVIRGDMSLVGPRPMMPQQQPLYPGTAYYRLRPGLTCLWQISDRNACSFAARADFDTRYERILSLRTDIAILFATVAVVLRGTGY